MDPSTITTKQAKELLDAQAHIWKHMFSFLNSMSLKCAIKLGIPDAIHKHGKPMTLAELTNALDIHPTKSQSLHRLMRFLSHSNFISKTETPRNGEPVFSLTVNSHLLLKDHPLTLVPFILGLLDPIMIIEPANYLENWFKNEEETPFHIAHGSGVWQYAGLVPEFSECFNEAMASESRFTASLLLANEGTKDIFEGIESLVDVGGGDGTMAKAIAKAYPGSKCVVFDLPHVVEGKSQENNGENLVYVGGDMFEAIPPANAILLKYILHDWSDEHCTKILKRCKEAILSKDKGGKVIIIDMVVENENDLMKQLDVHILVDMTLMSFLGGGRERTEEEWKKIFISAGFTDYKISFVLGIKSIIEIYP